ncbi:MAG: hypothetical protein N2167_03145 [Flavobacteriales bacterium]|nr:hypothetical protein [Flavobacteriales bacterium]
MKRISSKLALMSLSSMLLLSACHKHDETDVQIQITSPLTNSMYHLGDTVKIQGTITGNTEMHGYEVKIKNLSQGNVAFITDYHDHGSNYTINEFWVNNVTEHSDMRLVVKVEVDHSGTMVSDSLNFHCHPM